MKLQEFKKTFTITQGLPEQGLSPPELLSKGQHKAEQNTQNMTATTKSYEEVRRINSPCSQIINIALTPKLLKFSDFG